MPILKPLSEKQVQTRQRLHGVFRVFSLVYLVGSAAWFFRPSILEVWLTGNTLTIIVLILATFGIILVLYRHFGPRLLSKDDAVPHAIPIWMSNYRVVFALGEIEEDLKLSDIKQAWLDFSMGSPVLILQSSKMKIQLISSEIKNFETNFFSLRPDLEPTS